MTTEEIIAPLDAYATAKPDEPTFTLQGGDPLAPHLVRLWAWFARARAGVMDAESFGQILLDTRDPIIDRNLAHDEREKNSLLVRATAAEEVSWAMDAYLKGYRGEDKPSQAADTHLDELQRIDQHDLKVRVSQRLSNFRSEIGEMREALDKAGCDSDFWNDMLVVEQHLEELYQAIEPRRLFRKD